ncbi:MAG: hypothetical protein ACI4I9_08165 [Porcipelethomonas sp.]
MDKEIDKLIIGLCKHINNGIKCIFDETINGEVAELVNALANLISARNKNKSIDEMLSILDSNIDDYT